MTWPRTSSAFPGLEPGKDIEIVFTGIRPGEKLSEDLWGDGTEYQKTAHPDIFRVEAEESNIPSGRSVQHR